MPCTAEAAEAPPPDYPSHAIQAGPSGADHTRGHNTGTLARLTGLGHGRTGSPRARGGRYGLLLLVLISTYLLAAFNIAKLAADLQVVLFAVILLIALRSAPLPRPCARSSEPSQSLAPSHLLDRSLHTSTGTARPRPVEGPELLLTAVIMRAPRPGPADRHHPEHLRRPERLHHHRADVRLRLRRHRPAE